MRPTQPYPVRLSLLLVGTVVVAGMVSGVAQGIDFPGPDPGPARAEIRDDLMILENNVLRATWSLAGRKLRPKELLNRITGTALALEEPECFALVLGDPPKPERRVAKGSEFEISKGPHVADQARGRDMQGPRAAGPGKTLELALNLTASPLQVIWQVTLRDGASHMRQQVRVMERGGLEIVEIRGPGLSGPNVRVAGDVAGCPIVSGEWFVACEEPFAQATAGTPQSAGGTQHAFPSCMPHSSHSTHSDADWSNSLTFVIGAVPPGQMRRGFLHYLERERAHPYRPFLHYNNGVEIGVQYWKLRLQGYPAQAEQFRLHQEKTWLETIHAFGRELAEHRKVRIDSFVHDYEWDDETRVWLFHQGYPQGFSQAQQAAQQYGARLGVWLSPWGGYPCQPARIEFGRKQGFETHQGGLSLAGPRYYARFRRACEAMIQDYGANYFKFDGFAAGNNQQGPGNFLSDADALLVLLRRLRAMNPDVFLNVTTGSWPSPFWLLYADSIWRQGSDTGVLGKGSDRQQWITYRDSEVYHRIVQRSPLYPLNSLMLHGVFVNKMPLSGYPYDPKNPSPSVDPKDVIDEIRSFFGTGTNCQEMYINPALMTGPLWDALAEAANWSRRNADVLVDTHWIGGDPAKGEIYGYASWSKRQGILSLRNPDDKPAQIRLDIGQAFELPPGAPTRYTLKSPWKQDADRPAIELAAGQPHVFTLEPFQVLVLEALPAAGAK